MNCGDAMPINYLEIQKQVIEMAERSPARQRQQEERCQHATRLLEAHADHQDELRQKVENAAAANPSLRCAIPVKEWLTHCVDLPVIDNPYILLAADGSQIHPDRHDAVQFGVINAGALRMQPGSGEAPRETVTSRLLYHDDLEPPDGPLTEEVVALMRDLEERNLLLQLAKQDSDQQVVALTDGPLEPYVRDPRERQSIKKLFEDYFKNLQELGSLGVCLAGYVDKPGADLIVRLLEIGEMSEEDLPHAERHRPLRGLTDADLLHNRLQPGQRSAVFAIQSPAGEYFSGALALHFFYLNVGRADKPSLARIEFPAWVARSADLVDLLHAALVSQCRQMGARPYPYVLHRAHETAVVSMLEKQHLSSLIALQLRQHGVEPGDLSNKQFGKNNMGNRTRYKQK